MENNREKLVHVRLSGRVQGVGFRAWTVNEACGRGLRGWVRNRAGGDVEAVFGGPADAIDAMVAALRNGPAWAHVDHVAVRLAASDELDAASGPGRFVERPTV